MTRRSWLPRQCDLRNYPNLRNLRFSFPGPWLVALLLVMVGQLVVPRPAAAAGISTGNFYVLETTTGSTYYVMRLHLMVECPGSIPRRVREIQRLEGAVEETAQWTSLPAFDIQRHPRGYRLLSADEVGVDGEPKVLGYVDLPGESFAPECSHTIRAEGIGFDRRFDIRNIKWPLAVMDRRPPHQRDQ